MALDGIAVSAIVHELSTKLTDARLTKIAQPETDELFLTIKDYRTQYKLLISAGASLPLIYLTDEGRVSPLTAPNFCMLLRKHINSGRIVSITQPGLERIINIELEHYDEMGDLCRKLIIIELMGKHSNIIFAHTDGKIIDSIKHVSAQMSSVREVLPGREYFIPKTIDKKNPLTISNTEFDDLICSKPIPVSTAIYTTLTGISPIFAEEICYEAGINSEITASELSSTDRIKIYNSFEHIMHRIESNDYDPCIIYENGIPKDFSAFPLKIFADCETKHIESMSMLLETYYGEKNAITRIRQRSSDLRRIVQTALEKDYKKYDLQKKQLLDTEKRDKYKVYGELITAFGYNLEQGAEKLVAENYYDNNKEITIPLDNTISPMDNAKKYFDKYGKLKRTYEALSDIIKETTDTINHLESINTSLDIARDENDLKEIREELVQFGYIKRKQTDKKSRFKSVPMHYISSDGYDIYVGKNNYQNEELTFKVATGNDWWFHSKGCPGSHVIVKCGNDELPDKTFEEAGRLAAHYSKAHEQDKVEIDYVQKKNVKKVAGAKPGFVIYHTNFSMAISPDITGIKYI